jgi:DNA-binding IclR family transcriptional regulator
VLDDQDMVYLSIIESPQRVKLAAAIGQRLPAYATASGKAILAFLPEKAVLHILNQGMPRLTPYTHVTPEAFFTDLISVRERGFALSEQELEDDINAVAAPVFDMEGRPIASVAVASPAFRLTHERMMEIGPVLVSVTREISQEVKMAAVPRAYAALDDFVAEGNSELVHTSKSPLEN